MGAVVNTLLMVIVVARAAELGFLYPTNPALLVLEQLTRVMLVALHTSGAQPMLGTMGVVAERVRLGVPQGIHPVRAQEEMDSAIQFLEQLRIMLEVEELVRLIPNTLVLVDWVAVVTGLPPRRVQPEQLTPVAVGAVVLTTGVTLMGVMVVQG